MAQIRAAGIKSDLWTYNKFLSRRPIKNANAAIETPETSSLIAADTCLPGTFAAAVNPWSQRLRPTAGRLKKGHLSTRILFNSVKRVRRSFSLKPVPTLPANLSFLPS
jgi:hypothetical protein